jgi:hypothetical protein
MSQVFFEYELTAEVHEESPAVRPKLVVTGRCGDRSSRKAVSLSRAYPRLMEALWDHETEVRQVQQQIEDELRA